MVFKKLGVALSQLGDASGWPRLVEQTIRDWQQMDFALAPITTAPCANLSHRQRAYERPQGRRC